MPKKRNYFQRLSLFFFSRTKTTALLWLVITVFGIASYSTLLRREGFPSVNAPFAISRGAYLVNDPAKVDNDVAKPLSDFLLKQDGVKKVQTQSFDNFYIATVAFKDNVNAEARSGELQKAVENKHLLPPNATGKLDALKFGYTERGDDLVVSFYSKDSSVSTEQLTAKATEAAAFMKAQNLPLVEDISIISPFESATNPETGNAELVQKTFDRFGKREGEKNNFYNSIVIGVKSKPGADELELDKQVQSAVDKVNQQNKNGPFVADISASNAPSINMQVSELQQTLLEGLLAVLIVGSIIIAVRASIITVISMVTVIAAVNGLMYLIGYSLNTITLFALVLGLALIVDDTIIMVEAIDAQRRKRKNPQEVVEVATKRVVRAMIAATSTAALSFAPLLFVGGILGGFIRAIPVTIIAALIISLFVSLIFIPFFARFLLLRKNQLGAKNVNEPAARLEARIARFLSAPMLWAKHSRKKLFFVGITAVVIGLGFIGAGGMLFQKVKFSIFPVDKDSNQLSVAVTFPPGTDIQKAEQIADNVDHLVGDTVDSNFVKGSYYGQANIQSATLYMDIIDYKKRDITAPQLVDQLNNKFNKFDQASVKAGQLGAGPPAAAFEARVDSSKNRPGAIQLSNDIAAFLKKTELKRPDGSTAKLENIKPPNPDIYNRDNAKQYVATGAEFSDTDTSALVTLAQQAIEKEFPPSRVASYGLDQHALYFDLGQESENQDSFKTLAIAFPILLLAIYFLLAFQFRSLLQPLLIFLAIPFSLFGIALGLNLTNNPFSFFTMLGFFALLGLSIKNTILLTDYANQSRNAGLGPVDSAHEALAERFRPLIATSLTAVCSLIPLAITSPFWEGLAVVLIFGLLSSTFLVITVFPYYYLGSEFLRLHFSRKTVILWLVASIILIAILAKASFGAFAAFAPIVAAAILYGFKRRQII